MTSPRAIRAFTLVEALVVVAILTVLAAILMVALRSVWQTRNDVVDKNNLRNCVIDFVAFAQAKQDRFVNAGPPNDLDPALAPMFYGEGASREVIINVYESHQTHWTNALFAWGRIARRYWHSAYEDLPGPEVVSPGWSTWQGGGWQGMQYLNETKYVYSPAFLMRPEAFTTRGVSLSSEEWANRMYCYVRFSQVEHPSSKALLIQTDRPGNAAMRMYAFVDGSVRLLDRADAKPTAVPPGSNGTALGAPGLSTLNGWQGQDF